MFRVSCRLGLGLGSGLVLCLGLGLVLELGLGLALGLGSEIVLHKAEGFAQLSTIMPPKSTIN